MTGESQDRSAGRRQRNLKTATHDAGEIGPTKCPALAQAWPLLLPHPRP
jgi:hypothetical protein